MIHILITMMHVGEISNGDQFILWDMKLTTYLYLVPRSRMVELYLHINTFSWHGA
jgi:hypothetical protein